MAGSFRYDDDWFIRYRGHLLTSFCAGVERWPNAIHNLLRSRSPDPVVERQIALALERIPARHASAVRAHRQFYRAALLASGLLPADDLVNVAVQVEWFWYNTAALSQYRDHLAHVMKVSALGLGLLCEETSPLALGRTPLLERVAEGLAQGKLGSAAIRATARRCGNSEEALTDPRFWRVVVPEVVRLAGLLHDMAHPAVMVSKMESIAAPIRLRSPFEQTEAELAHHVVAAFGHRLLGAPFFRGELPPATGLPREALEHCARIFQRSHGLRAGYAIARLAEEASRVWQLNPRDVFILEWVALAVSLHEPECFLPRFEADAGGQAWLQENQQWLRPCFQEDPASYLVALGDFMQEFGRVYVGPSREEGAQVSYPCSAVNLEVTQDQGYLTFELGPAESAPFGATSAQAQQLQKSKERQARRLLGQGQSDGLLDHTGLLRGIAVTVVHESLRPKAAVTIFVCYAARDEKDVRKGLEDLAWLRDRGVEFWEPGQASPGLEREPQVRVHLEGAALILLMVSSHLLSSPEERQALAQHERSKVPLVPVVLSPTPGVDKTYQGLQVVNTKPVSAWKDQAGAWKHVADRLLQLLPGP